MCISSTKTEGVSLNEFTSEKIGIDLAEDVEAKTAELNLILGNVLARFRPQCRENYHISKSESVLKVSPN